MSAPDQGWTTAATGLSLSSRAGAPVHEMVTLGLRRNPRRAHLLVSRVLGKHVPAPPALVLDAGARLGALAAGAVGPGSAAVLGYAETATGLGHAVAQVLAAPYLHSTRRAGAGAYAGFAEEHSHAVEHRLLPAQADLLEADVLVLVDDELSTGRTVLNTLSALAPVHRHQRCVVAVLVDARSEADAALTTAQAAAMGVDLQVVSCCSAALDAPHDVLERAERARAGLTPSRSTRRLGAEVTELGSLGWPAEVPESARHGLGALAGAALVAAAREAGARLAERVEPAPGERVLVVGTEELMWAPQQIAAALQERVGPAVQVLTSSTTASPVLVVDDPGYPVRTSVAFVGPQGERYAHNAGAAAGASPYEHVVVVDDAHGASAGLAAATALAGVCDRAWRATLPTHAPQGAR